MSGVYVSVILPVAPGDVERAMGAVESISRAVAYATVSCEILVVVDSSTDSSHFREFRRRVSPEVRVVGSGGSGSYGARRLGAHVSRGTLLFFTDADCLVDEGWVAAGVATFEKTSAAAVQGESRGHLPQRRIARMIARAYSRDFAKWARADECERLDTRNCAIRRSVYDEVGGFDDRLHYWGDAALGRRVRREGFAIVLAPSMGVTHRDIDSMLVAARKAYVTGRQIFVTMVDEPDSALWESFPHLLYSKWWLRARRARMGYLPVAYQVLAWISAGWNLIRVAATHRPADRFSLLLADFHGLGYLAGVNRRTPEQSSRLGNVQETPTPNSLAVVIPHRNGETILRSVLEQVTTLQVKKPHSVVVVDGGSQDGSLAMLRREFPQVIVVRTSGKFNWARNCNLGISVALRQNSDIVLLLNNDVLVTPELVAATSDCFGRQESPGILGYKIFQGYFEDDPDHAAFDDAVSRRAPISLRSAEHILGTAVAIHRRVFATIGGFDEAFTFYGEEEEYVKRAEAAGLHRAKCNLPVWHRNEATIEGSGAWTKARLTYSGMLLGELREDGMHGLRTSFVAALRAILRPHRDRPMTWADLRLARVNPLSRVAALLAALISCLYKGRTPRVSVRREVRGAVHNEC